jgi:ankyrin repeat protein
MHNSFDISRFLLAQLNLDSLTDKLTPKAIKLALAELPRGSDALDCAYKEAMERIEAQKPSLMTLAKQTLSLITCARSPLEILALCHALAVEPGDSDIDSENILDREDIVSVCAGLVTIDEQSNIVRLVHYTTQQYFERTRTIWFPDAHAEMTMRCTSYLSLDPFAAGPCRLFHEYLARLRLYPFYAYAANSWSYHVQAASLQTDASVLRFLTREIRAPAANQAEPHTEGLFDDFHRFKTQRYSALHIAAYFGLDQTMEILLQHADVNCRTLQSETPLLVAVKHGHEKVAKLLLDHGAERDYKDRSMITPLYLAARGGDEGMTRLLLDYGAGEDWNLVGTMTPLSAAAQWGRENIVNLFLKNGASLKITADQIHGALARALLERQQRTASALGNYAAAMGWQGDDLQLFNGDRWKGVVAYISKSRANDARLLNLADFEEEEETSRARWTVTVQFGCKGEFTSASQRRRICRTNPSVTHKPVDAVSLGDSEMGNA